MNVIRGYVLAVGLAVLAMPAVADVRAERFVKTSLERVVGQLFGSGDASPEARRRTFGRNLGELADIRRIGRFVLGRYGRGMSEDDLDRYLDTFEVYLGTIYYQQVRRLDGASFHVLGSVDIKQGDSIVKTEIRTAGDEQSIRIDWRVQSNGDGHKVLDVAISPGGNQIWLAQEQRAQFMAILEQGNGNIDSLISRMKDISDRTDRRQNR